MTQSEAKATIKNPNSEDSLLSIPALKTLAPLPKEVTEAQCVTIGDEILICGGGRTKDCFSYHVKKGQYKRICAYGREIALVGHSVVLYPLHLKKSNGRQMLLSFGGDVSRYGAPYHTKWLTYQSVWEEKPIEDGMNQWTSIPNEVTFGKEGQHDLCGARASVGGANNDLLFITRKPQYIDVIDLKSFTYLQNVKYQDTMPIRENLGYHCLVPFQNKNGMVVIQGNECVLVKFDELQKEFRYSPLPGFEPFNQRWGFACAQFNRRIFFFGGSDFDNETCMDDIISYQIDSQLWSKCNVCMPFPIRNSAIALVHSSIHLIGGMNDDYNPLAIHYILSFLVHFLYVIKKNLCASFFFFAKTPEKVKTIVTYWWKQDKRKGLEWAKDLFSVIAIFCL
ncbi:hypothetical protein RFI_17632 [Reticulomyxa filosa]|uniref:Kelch motif family protein n=1 Tax=Reticulomyxa filosa TaxID=46433 RepID=X6N1I6_RETFI|nr:hypothetical protein RFI_17632 [Reticulomyxa filosa]|eukprot:ETO19599.1 hypothetical protein RFI_17632 [Reticulomyxa filosa]